MLNEAEFVTFWNTMCIAECDPFALTAITKVTETQQMAELRFHYTCFYDGNNLSDVLELNPSVSINMSKSKLKAALKAPKYKFKRGWKKVNEDNPMWFYILHFIKNIVDWTGLPRCQKILEDILVQLTD